MMKVHVKCALHPVFPTKTHLFIPHLILRSLNAFVIYLLFHHFNLKPPLLVPRVLLCCLCWLVLQPPDDPQTHAHLCTTPTSHTTPSELAHKNSALQHH